MDAKYLIKEERAKKIVCSIIDDLSDRRGLRQEWEKIDEDIQNEIKESWISIVLGDEGEV